MKRFVLTPRAKQSVNDIWDYIAVPLRSIK
jgi:plasmid stabilization system protein ParE